jgi:chaperonin GroEL (HSP60 family)
LLEGVHPRILVEGIKLGSSLAISETEKLKIKINNNQALIDGVIRSTYLTKVPSALANKLAEITSEAVRIIKIEGKEIGILINR